MHCYAGLRLLAEVIISLLGVCVCVCVCLCVSMCTYAGECLNRVFGLVAVSRAGDTINGDFG